MADMLVSIFYQKTESLHAGFILTDRQQETLKASGADLDDPRSIFEHLINDTEHGGPSFLAGRTAGAKAAKVYSFESGSMSPWSKEF